MDIRQLKYFVAIAEEGTISAAANKLHISQPPLSAQLRGLEEELGVILVERGARHATLTDAGSALYKRARQILDVADATVREMQEMGDGLRGTLRLGTVSSSGPALLNHCLPEFCRAYPGIRFELHEGNTFELLELLSAGMIEVAVVRTPFQQKNVERIELPPEPMVAFGTEGMLGELPEGPAPLAALAAKPLIVYRRFEQLLGEAFAAEGLQPQYLCENDDARTTLFWAQAGLGVALVPESAVQYMLRSGMQTRRVDHRGLVTQVTAIHRRGVPLSTAGKRFLEIFSRNA